jgi:hypothetical protein
MMNRKRLFLLLLALPVVILIAQLLSLQTAVWRAGEPRWVVDSEAGYYSSCTTAAQLERYHAALIDEAGALAVISRQRAEEISQHVLARHYGPAPVLYSHGPALAIATFPDGQKRFTWYRVMLYDGGGATLMGRGMVVYLDAFSGEPLLLIRDVTVGDPTMVCDMDFTPSIRILLLLGLVAYLVVVGLLGGLLWLLRRRRLSRSTA